eukprot:CAMPEP_0184360460 /NCGR_PEP_ID=MMETSP1089-20130417/125138_1 /TAXON_ID=38269 ORGANISM="Gloeochaete wittrockiana, Strain SAG46.84" /NCGR_SAMPLE_ID=MMETSP1089 /ASSEMBLY_ACC=CAM_ASM_000445 /LENGTH=91 /DNA_ID=CAMNT_0026699659 /DNA_START=16 /DNA_END=287 /DNA_ORIENTATION=+
MATIMEIFRNNADRSGPYLDEFFRSTWRRYLKGDRCRPDVPPFLHGYVLYPSFSFHQQQQQQQPPPPPYQPHQQQHISYTPTRTSPVPNPP